MTHQIPPHLAFCTPGQNQKEKQGTNPETLKRNKQIQNPHFQAPSYQTTKDS